MKLVMLEAYLNVSLGEVGELLLLKELKDSIHEKVKKDITRDPSRIHQGRPNVMAPSKHLFGTTVPQPGLKGLITLLPQTLIFFGLRV